MLETIAVYKPVGLTPLEALDRLRIIEPVYSQEKLTYAGRLDPLAEGVTLILVGETAKQAADWWGLDKDYQLKVLFGVITDTGDIMGLVKEFAPGPVERAELQTVATDFLGRRRQTAPRFSSPGLDGKIFTKDIEIYQLKIGGMAFITATDLLVDIEKRLKLVTGQFRQDRILAKWQNYLADADHQFSVASLSVSCSAGTYMRVLAEELGRAVGRPALAYTICRTRVGDFGLDQARPLPVS